MREEYRIHYSLAENSVEDDKEGGIGVGDAPVASGHGVLVAAAEVDEPLCFLDDSAIWCSY